MTRMLSLLILTSLVAVGCRSYDKPRDLREKPRPNLDNLSAEEQGKRIRGRYSLPQDDFRIGPRTGIDRSTPVGW
ncbi:MAG: hypothetical protein ACRC8S_19485 [Fimbriiglobus sp.]